MDIDSYQDIIDVRDIIEHYEDVAASADPDDREEMVRLEILLSDLRGSGGDHQWEGNWYPVTLIRDSYFIDYAQSYAEDIGLVSDTATGWPFDYIDWERAADALQMDYTSVDYDGITYWYR
jgi:hypothetical protein